MTDTASWSRPARMLLLFAAFVVSIAGIRAVAPILVPLLLAVFVSIVCAPLFLGLQRLRFPPFLALTVLFLILVAITFVGVAFLEQSVDTLRAKLPLYQETLQQRSNILIAWLEAHGVEPDTLELKRILDWRQGFRLAGSSLATLTGLLGTAFLVLLLTAFILIEASMLPAKLRSFGEFSLSFWSNLQQTLSEIRRYMALKTLMSLLTGFLVGVLLAITGADFVLLLGFTAFALNYIPTIGSILAAIPGILLSLIQHGPGVALIVTLGYIVINVSVSNIVEPRVMGRGLGLSPLVVVISMVFWGWVLGPVGMLLSVPLTMTGKIAMRDFEETRWLTVLLSGGVEERSDAPVVETGEAEESPSGLRAT